MNTRKILFVDEPSEYERRFVDYFKRASFEITFASTNLEAMNKLLGDAYDVVVCEMLTKGVNGQELLRQVRGLLPEIPFIFFAQHGESVERARVLHNGADDYVLKGIHLDELIARINVVLRWQVACIDNTLGRFLVSGDLSLDRLQRRVINKGTEVPLTPKAVAVLEYLMLCTGKPVTREELLNAVWGWDTAESTRAVDARINEIRRSLNCTPTKPYYIQTLFRKGYMFVVPVNKTD